MKRYWVFAYDNYYPRGGVKDFCESFDTVDAAKAYAIQLTAPPEGVFIKWDRAQILDTETFTFCISPDFDVERTLEEVQNENG